MSLKLKKAFAWLGVGVLAIMAAIFTQRPEITFGFRGFGISVWVVLAAIAVAEAVYILATTPKQQ